MKTCHRRHRKAPLASVLAAAAATLIAQSACAQADEPNPYYIGVSQSFTHDSNIYRLRDEDVSGVPVVADTISSTGLVAGIDQPFGRQHFYADGAAHYNRFRDNTDLNNTSYDLTTGLDWSTIERLSGKLKYTAGENLATYSSGNTLEIRKKNIERDQHFNAIVDLGLVSLLSLEGTYTYDSLHYTAPEYQTFNFHDDVYSLGVKYRPSGALTLGLAGRTTRGTYPDRGDLNALTGELSFRRNDVDLTGEWIVSGLSTIVARASYGKQTYSDARGSDFKGFTGSLGWDYRPTGKLHLSTYLARDTGQASVNTPFFGTVLSAESSRVKTLAQMRAIYDLTGKIQLSGTARYEHRNIADVHGVFGGDTTDNTRHYELGVQYAALRSLLLSCSVSRESRTAGNLLDVSYPYHVNTGSCGAQFTLQ